MITIALFAVAAAAGTLARAEAARRWNHYAGIPAGTLAVNVTGSFCLGLLSQLGSPALTVIGVGALGAYTTFSSFARDTIALADDVSTRHAAVLRRRDVRARHRSRSRCVRHSPMTTP